MVDEYTLDLERLNDLSQAVNAVQGVEVETKDELRFIQHMLGTQFLPCKNNDISHTGNELQRLGSHIGSHHRGILAQAAQHVA